MKKNVFAFIEPYKHNFIIGPIAKLIEAIFEIFLPTMMALIINQGILHKDKTIIFRYGLLMISMVLIGFCFSLVCQYQAAKASQGFGTDLRNYLYAHILSLSFREIDKFGSSSLTNRLTNDVNQLQLAIAMFIRLVVRAPFICIGAIVMAMFLDMPLAFILVLITPIIFFVLIIFIRLTASMYQKYQKKLDKFGDILFQQLSGIRVIRAFVKQKSEEKVFHDSAYDLQKQMLKVSRLNALLSPLTALIVNGAVLAILWFGGNQIEIGGLQAGTIVAFVNYATQILLALMAISNLIVIFTKANASYQRVQEILDAHSSITYGQVNTYQESDCIVTFDHVTFAYHQNEEPVLENMSFRIYKDEKIGIIGGTGSGKSTLLNVMQHFYEPQSGTITILGRDLKEYSKEEINNIIAYVPQKNILFTGTIQDNLYFGNSNATYEDMQQALDIAQASDFVKDLSDGIKSHVKRDGTNFSGGQRQRLCIARALLKQAPILIFDDSFSALDMKTDALLRQGLNTLTSTKAQFIVSQRISTIMNCNRIMVIHDGEIVGFDSHEKLLNTCEIYKEIYTTQELKEVLA